MGRAPQVLRGALLAICGFSGAIQAAASEQTPSLEDGWELRVTPFGWVPGVGFNVFSPAGFIEIGESTFSLGNLSSFFMVDVELRKGRWGAVFDFASATFSNSIGLNVDGYSSLDYTQRVKTQSLLVLYRAYQGKKLTLDGVVGRRGFSFEFDGNLQSTSGSRVNLREKMGLHHMLVGARVQYHLAEKWAISGMADYGLDGDWQTSSYQAIGAVSYALNPSVDLLAGYRFLRIETRGTIIRGHVDAYGPFIGASFSF